MKRRSFLQVIAAMFTLPFLAKAEDAPAKTNRVIDIIQDGGGGTKIYKFRERPDDVALFMNKETCRAHVSLASRCLTDGDNFKFIGYCRRADMKPWCYESESGRLELVKYIEDRILNR